MQEHRDRAKEVKERGILSLSFFAVAFFSSIIQKFKTRSGTEFAISRVELYALIWLAVLITNLEDAGVGAHFMDCRTTPGSISTLHGNSLLFDAMHCIPEQVDRKFGSRFSCVVPSLNS